MKSALSAFLLGSLSISAHAIDWGVQSDFDSQLYPSYTISTAASSPDEAGDEDLILGDPDSFLGVWTDGLKPGDTYKITLRKSDLWEESVAAGTVPEGLEETIYIAPKINYLYEKLRDVDQMRPINAIFDVKFGGEDAGTKSLTVNVRSINDCPYGLSQSEEDIEEEEDEEKEPEAEYIDLGWMFAAYVNESHPMLDQILKGALDTDAINSFDDYQSGSKAKVLAQVYAIYAALHERGIQYSNVVSVPKASQLIYSQNVRFIEQSIDNHQANCVDGSVLMASLLRKIGLNPFLVLVPGHMYLGVYLDPENKEYIGIETTVLGVEDVGSPGELAELRELLADELEGAPSLVSFEAAVQIGTADLEKNSDNFGKDNPVYQLIDVKAAREDGIMPIPYKKDK